MRIKAHGEKYAVTGPAAAASYLAEKAIEEHNEGNIAPLLYMHVVGTSDHPRNDKAVAIVFGDTLEEVTKMHSDMQEAFELLDALRLLKNAHLGYSLTPDEARRVLQFQAQLREVTSFHVIVVDGGFGCTEHGEDV